MMRQLSILVFCLIFSNVFAQEIIEKEIRTEVSEVTVFIEGAQITHQKTVDLVQGKTILKFINLSPFIEAKSIQVKAEGEVTVLSVNHQQNFMDKLEKNQGLTDLEAKLETIVDKIKLEEMHLTILKDEMTFLNENRNLGGKNQELSVANLKEASVFYSDKMTALRLKEIERNKTVEDLGKQKKNLEDQIKMVTSKKEFPSGEIVVKVDAKKNSQVSFEISYLLKNAGWFPSYDIRVNNINEPVELIYKANIRQDTKIDWNGVKLKLSSSDPNISGVAPQLKTYFIDYNSRPPVYTEIPNTVSGKVVDNNQEPLPGANIMVQGTTIGTVADMDGNFSITIPKNASHLVFTFIGFNTQTLPISNSVMYVSMVPNDLSLEEVVVVGYGVKSEDKISDALEGRMAGVSVIKDITEAKHTKETGEIKWEFSLLPGTKKELQLRYSVKYPKNNNLIIE